ncbi:MAG TPA: hypothetical protein PKA76_19335 [Pirellulaceae bacterium]|nr:hypothetical protein [Pirellulaceae bacterium]HMP71509.1 hypothetical protein [Pirellulaceae bacterium]
MQFRLPRSSFYGGRIIDVYSLNSFPADDDQPNDPASVRFRSIAEILLRGIQRCVAANRDFGDDLSEGGIKGTFYFYYFFGLSRGRSED